MASDRPVPAPRRARGHGLGAHRFGGVPDVDGLLPGERPTVTSRDIGPLTGVPRPGRRTRLPSGDPAPGGGATTSFDGAAPVRRVLSAVEFDVVWEALELGPTPVVLDLASPGRTHTARRRIVADTWEGLRARGLAGPDGPERGLVRFLRLLAASPRTVEVRAWGTAPLRASAATGGPAGTGVLARRHGEAVVLDRCTSPAGAVVGVLPRAPAGPGRAANVATTAVAEALTTPTGAGLRADLCARGVPPDDAGLVAHMLGGVRGRTELSVVAVDRWGLRHRSPDVLAVLDGPRGRYLVTRCGDWTTVAPVDDRRLRVRVADLVGDAAVSQSRSPWRISCRPDSVIEPDSDG